MVSGVPGRPGMWYNKPARPNARGRPRLAADKNARRGIGEEALYDKGKNCAHQRAGAKSRSQGLTEQEKAEQAALRREYIDAMSAC